MRVPRATEPPRTCSRTHDSITSFRRCVGCRILGPVTAHARFTIDADITPRFTACYLRVAGDECAFIEAHTTHALPRLLAALAEHGKKPEDVRYVVVTHAHLDHAAGASA